MKKHDGFPVYGEQVLTVRVKALEDDLRSISQLLLNVTAGQKAVDVILQALLDVLGNQQEVLDRVRTEQVRKREADLVGGQAPLAPEEVTDDDREDPAHPGQDA